MIWEEYVARMGEMINTHKVLVGKLKEGEHSENLGVDGKIILECVLEKQSWKM
jgi:hypothetical protein